MAPEQAAADPHIDHRVDIYAVGAMGYELLTGRAAVHRPVLARGAGGARHPAARADHLPATGDLDRPGRHRDEVPGQARRGPLADADELVTQLEQQLTPSGGMTPTQTQTVATATGIRATHPGGRCSAPWYSQSSRVAFFSGGAARDEIPVLGKRSAVTLESGLETNAAISPDGKLVAYSRITPAESRLVVQQLAGGEPVTVARGPAW